MQGNSEYKSDQAQGPINLPSTSRECNDSQDSQFCIGDSCMKYTVHVRPVLNKDYIMRNEQLAALITMLFYLANQHVHISQYI